MVKRAVHFVEKEEERRHLVQRGPGARLKLCDDRNTSSWCPVRRQYHLLGRRGVCVTSVELFAERGGMQWMIGQQSRDMHTDLFWICSYMHAPSSELRREV